MLRNLSYFFSGLLLSFAVNAYAEVNRVYHPYVEEHEREIEYGFVLRDVGDKKILLNRAGIGYAWNARFFSEIYLLTESVTHEDEQARGYEAEFKWQLTEQGEHWADWGVLMEIGETKDIDSHELSTALLWEKEIGQKWVATANFFIEYEWGSDIKDEFESALRTQLRYRNSARLDPAIELYLDDQDWALGPSLMGTAKLGARKQLSWELGVVFGLNSDTPKTTFRGGIEFEF